MLVRLSVKNLAIIQQADVLFHEGLNVITGETGAGKSILLGALGLLTGGKADRELIRTGEKSLFVEGEFLASAIPQLNILLEELGFEPVKETLVLSRTFSAGGRGSVRVNGQSASVAALRRIGASLVEINGQHDQRFLLDVNMHRSLLDTFGGYQELLEDCREQYSRLASITARLRTHRMNTQEKARRIDFLNFQCEEISGIDPRLNEDVALREEMNRLAHAEEITRLAGRAYDQLQKEEGSILDALASVGRDLGRLSDIDESTAEMVGRCDSLRLELEDMAVALGEYSRGCDFDPGRLTLVEERLYSLDTLKKKYGPELSDVLAFHAQCGKELAELELGKAEDNQLETRQEEAALRFAESAAALHEERARAARSLEKAMVEELTALAMERAVFDVRTEKEDDETSPVVVGGRQVAFDEEGVDTVQFFLSPNPGEDVRPLARIASGGELSRIMLALKNVIRERGGGEKVLVFDEVDAGIGGRVARVVGSKLKAIATGDQVICITHLPQIAAAADRHLSVCKREEYGRTRVFVFFLDEEQRHQEIARMLGGEETPSAAVLQSAGRLIDLSTRGGGIQKTS